ncbi:MAG: alkylmercury lyase family protein [Candidatus Methylomirabilales bacterium]
MALPDSLDTIATRLANADLTQKEEEVRRAILRAFATSGTSPTVADIIALLPELGPHEVTHICRRLGEKDLIVWEETEQYVRSAYPFSGLPTIHIVRLKGGRTAFALCAVDALGIPVMLGQAADIVSRCAQCQIPVAVAVTPGGLGQYRPRESVVWFPLAADVCCPVAESRCPDINFFCSPDHRDAWWQSRDRPDGLALTMAEAFEAGREIFGALLITAESTAESR